MDQHDDRPPLAALVVGVEDCYPRVSLRAYDCRPGQPHAGRHPGNGLHAACPQPQGEHGDVAGGGDESDYQPGGVATWQVVGGDMTEKDVHPPVVRHSEAEQNVRGHGEEVEAEQSEQDESGPWRPGEHQSHDEQDGRDGERDEKVRGPMEPRIVHAIGGEQSDLRDDQNGHLDREGSRAKRPVRPSPFCLRRCHVTASVMTSTSNALR